MVDEVTPKKHRHQRGYTILIVSADSDGSTGTLRISPFAAQALAFAAFFAAVLLICYIVYSVMTINGLQHVQLLQSDQIHTLSEEREALATQNSDLSAMVEQLSRSINQKVVKESNAEKADAEKHFPSGFPLTGTATMTNTKDLQEADTIEEAIALLNERIANGESADSVPGDPILYFTGTAEGSSVVATGAGTVTEISEDRKYGTRIVIDHGSGYQTIYRYNGDAMVRAGDEVTRGSILFLIGDSDTVGYQILQDGEFIDPEALAQIDG